MMSFICLDADSYRLIALLGDRFNRTIKNFFIAHYSLTERTRVQTVTMDMNAAYQTIIHDVFPKSLIGSISFNLRLVPLIRYASKRSNSLMTNTAVLIRL